MLAVPLALTEPVMCAPVLVIPSILSVEAAGGGGQRVTHEFTTAYTGPVWLNITVTDGASVHERASGSYTWAGINNTHFWVDPKNGIGVVMMTQVLPFYNATSMDVMKRFEHVIYEHLSAK